MGNSTSTSINGNGNAFKEKPSEEVDATLYYFGGRGRADQIRWMMAATGVSFQQRVISDRERFVRLSENQLPFRQLPMLQIDGQDLAQTQAIIRYLARRANMNGTNSVEEVQIDMICEAVHDILPFVLAAPFIKAKSESDWEAHSRLAKVKWSKFGSRLDLILKNNGGKVLVGSTLSCADILVAHVTTWFIEEFGADIVNTFIHLVELQYLVISLPGIDAFIKNNSLYYPLGGPDYVAQVNEVLGR